MSKCYALILVPQGKLREVLTKHKEVIPHCIVL